jgi:hypothetical protein
VDSPAASIRLSSRVIEDIIAASPDHGFLHPRGIRASHPYKPANMIQAAAASTACRSGAPNGVATRRRSRISRRHGSRQETGSERTVSVARVYREKLKYMKACCVLGSKSLTRCLGMPPSGETAIPMRKINHPQRTMSMASKCRSVGSFPLDACAATLRSIENGAAHTFNLIWPYRSWSR